MGADRGKFFCITFQDRWGWNTPPLSARVAQLSALTHCSTALYRYSCFLRQSRKKPRSIPVHQCRHPPVNFLLSFHRHNFHSQFPFYLFICESARVYGRPAKRADRFSSAAILHSDHSSSTFVFSYHILSYYFHTSSLNFAFSLSCQISNHILGRSVKAKFYLHFA